VNSPPPWPLAAVVSASVPPVVSAPWPPSVAGRLLYENPRAAPAAFTQVLQTFLAAGYAISSPPVKDHAGCSARVSNGTEVLLQWRDTQSLRIFATAAPYDQIKRDVSRLLAGTAIAEVQIV
jgi:hypothetical protein